MYAWLLRFVTRWGGPGGIEAYTWEHYFLQCFDTVGWVIWPAKTVPEMTYNVFSGTLNTTHSLTHSLTLTVFSLTFPRRLLNSLTLSGPPHSGYPVFNNRCPRAVCKEGPLAKTAPVLQKSHTLQVSTSEPLNRWMQDVERYLQVRGAFKTFVAWYRST